MSKRIAAIDIGTVTTRLLIADIAGKTIKHLVYDTAFTHLGKGLAQTGAIGSKGRKLLCQALKTYKSKIEASRADITVACATSAMRDATNSADILADLSAEGISVQIIDGEQEAALSFEGVVSGFDTATLPSKLPVLVIDVGGGSTELIVGTVDEKQNKGLIGRSKSFDVGARRATDTYLAGNPPTDHELEACRAWSVEQFETWLNQGNPRPSLAFIIGGSASAAAAIYHEMQVYDPAKIHGTGLSIDVLEDMVAHLAAMPLARRERVVGLERDRAGVIVGGLLTIVAALRAAGMSSCIVSETGILDGIIRSTYQGGTS